jgi:hypothetical protein
MMFIKVEEISVTTEEKNAIVQRMLNGWHSHERSIS